MTSDESKHQDKETTAAKSANRGKLTVEERIAIALSNETSRELAARYGVHHSRICDIRKDATQLLEGAWSQRRPGPKPTPPEPESVAAGKRDLDELQHKHELLEMRNDWLTLQLQMHEVRDAEVEKRQSRNKRKKKARQRRKRS